MASTYTWRKVLFLPDIHVPWQDESALKVVREFQKDWKPDITMILGDLVDLHTVGKFVSDSDVSLEAAYDQANDILDTFQPDVVFEGNHEVRVRRPGNIDIRNRSLLDPRKNLRIDERKIRWVPYNNNPKIGAVKTGKLKALHGFWTDQYAARTHAAAFGCCIFGHTHRRQIITPGRSPITNTGFNIGCLCKLDMPWQQEKPPMGWLQAFGFAYVRKNGHFSAYVPALKGRHYMIEGKEYQR